MDTTLTQPQPNSFLNKRQNLIIGGLLFAILALGAFLRFYNLGEAGIGNEYYAAAVKSMLLSWKNFFFVAFEPGGSVSVDKPPLGFWIEAASAYLFGLNGFALALPNAIAGVLSIFVTYKLVRRPFGPWIGLVAALTLAVTPSAIATERNNTIDGMLVFTLLLAAWAFLQAAYTGKMRWLLVGAFMVGLGFNIKMLQAFLPLPAFYAVYFFDAKHGWWKKIAHLAIATALLAVVSLSWAVIVDLTPASERPYVDSSSNNTVMELIAGHNGLERLIGGGGNGPDGQNQPSTAQMTGPMPQPPDGQNFQPGEMPQGQPPANGMGLDDQMNGQPGGMGGGSMDFGTAGTLRLFTSPLSDEVSWLLPFVLGGLVLLAFLFWKQPFGEQSMAFILWAGWLIPETLYFSYSSGLMHAYYLIMLAAPLAALTGMTIWGLWKMLENGKVSGWVITAILAAWTLAFQASVLWNTGYGLPLMAVAGILFGVGLALGVVGKLQGGLVRAAITLTLVSLLVSPGAWSALTTFNSSPNMALPNAGPSQQQRGPGMGGESANENLLSYLLENTEPGTYLLATGRANSAAPYILATGRPVLALGGFLGQYTEVSLDQFTTLVENGQLRFVLGDEFDRQQEIAQWVQQNCTSVEAQAYSGSVSLVSNTPGWRGSNASLYDCGK
jgi:4-amino-4-deoxy-L-arabinose transferase-like glycosyltransferase